MSPKNSATKIVFDWYQKNKDKLANTSNKKAGVKFNERYPEIATASSASAYIQRIRSGKLTEEYFYEEEIPELDEVELEPEKEPEPNFNTSFFEKNMIEFPVSWAESYVPYKIDGPVNLGICGDIHIPYHDTLALSACFSEFKKRNIDGLYLNGDILDYEKISRFGSMPDGRYLKDEINAGREFLKALRRMFPKIPIYYKSGNHERRLESYIMSKCPELANAFGMDTPTQLGFHDLDIIHIPENIVSQFGKLWVAHGHEIAIGGGVNIARQARLKVGVNIIIGHFHKHQEDQSRNLADDVHTAIALGCLCYLKPRYTGALNQWSQSAATVDLLSSTGEFRVNTFKIINGKVI